MCQNVILLYEFARDCCVISLQIVYYVVLTRMRIAFAEHPDCSLVIKYVSF